MTLILWFMFGVTWFCVVHMFLKLGAICHIVNINTSNLAILVDVLEKLKQEVIDDRNSKL
jgi:uncharacterized membrane protein YccF (DUF307 family)